MTDERSSQAKRRRAGHTAIKRQYNYFGSHLIQRAPEPDANRVFLSYARADDHEHYHDPAQSFLRRLYNALTDDYDVWWDRERMPSRGRTFTDEIRTAIADADCFVLVVGAGIHASAYVQMEVKTALRLCIPIIYRLSCV